MPININDYRYELSADRIAAFPLPVRDESKLLVFQKGAISHDTFRNIDQFLPSNAFLYFNDTKVIPARLLFEKDTGSTIEIFLLNPARPSTVISEVMTPTQSCGWHCTIGNLKRWATGLTLTKKVGATLLHAELVDRSASIVQFKWTSGKTFAEVVSDAGLTPLPPYLKRDVVDSDKQRYQTIYSHHEGAVAAPTAGLHFTERVFKQLEKRHIGHDFLTLHVSAGTFQPVKADNADDHVMHHEQVVVSKKNLENLLKPDRFTVAVGTTSMRTLESIYWYGVKLIENAQAVFDIAQDEPYQDRKKIPSVTAAIQAVLESMSKRNQEQLIGETAIFIKPGYEFKVCGGLITNFHQPGSTLMLLVAAFIGEPWKKVYAEAMANNYRFLSYGDSSLLIP